MLLRRDNTNIIWKEKRLRVAIGIVYLGYRVWCAADASKEDKPCDHFPRSPQVNKCLHEWEKQNKAHGNHVTGRSFLLERHGKFIIALLLRQRNHRSARCFEYMTTVLHKVQWLRNTWDLERTTLCYFFRLATFFLYSNLAEINLAFIFLGVANATWDNIPLMNYRIQNWYFQCHINERAIENCHCLRDIKANLLSLYRL